MSEPEDDVPGNSSEELEEFDADLELQLKKEYAAVFQLFRYCVMTQEATYLCNELQINCAAHAGFLLFDITLEDVWVWDRNRPRRIIPRAQVFTTADVTIEQLKEDEEGRTLGDIIPGNVIEQLQQAGAEYELQGSAAAAAAEAAGGAAAAPDDGDDAPAGES
jgi:hypothetical protein